MVRILLKEVNLSLDMYEGEHKGCAMFQAFMISMLGHVFFRITLCEKLHHFNSVALNSVAELVNSGILSE